MTGHACTIAEPVRHATIEARVSNGADFCELAGHALGAEVFHSGLVLAPGRLFHYADGLVSCRLRYRRSAFTLTIRNAPAACQWFGRPSTGWHRV